MITLGWIIIGTACVAIANARSGDLAPWLQRVCAGAGVLSIAALVALGAVWPSYYTIAALVALPAAGLLLARVLVPRTGRGRWSRAYVFFALALSPAAFAVQYWWLHGGCQALGKCI